MANCVLKVHYPATAATKAVRTFKFVPQTTVGEAIERVSERGLPEGVFGASDSENFAFFSRVHGWLAPSSTLEDLGLTSGAELDFRSKQQKRTVCNGRLDTSAAVLWRDDLPIKRNLVELARQFGSRQLLTEASARLLRHSVLLNKNELLLSYPLPENAEYILAAQEGWKYSECSDEELLEHLQFYVLTPYCEGELWKKSATGFRRGWKKVWVRLQRETLSFYPEQASTTPLGGVHIRNMEFCYQSEPIDAPSKKLGNIFRLGTTSSEKVIYLGVASKELLPRWIKAITDWIGMAEFFRPKAITERGFALSHILSGQIRPNPKTYPGGEASGIEFQQNAQLQQQQQQQQQLLQQQQQQQQKDPLPVQQPPTAASLSREVSRIGSSSHEDTTSGPALDVQPNREITVTLLDGSFREMVVDSRLDVYELAYMIAEEIRSENAFVISPDDFGPSRSLELLDHQASLASQQVPLSARFSIRKTGIVDDFVKECDIYDNHFLFVSLPELEGRVLVQDESGGWREIGLRLFAGKFCCVDENGIILACVVMRHVLSIFRTPPEVVDPVLADFAFTIALSGDRELHFLADSLDVCDEWCDLDGWCGFNCNNLLLDPTDHFSWKLYEFGKPVDNAVSWLGVPELGVSSPRGPLSQTLQQQSSGENLGLSPKAQAHLKERQVQAQQQQQQQQHQQQQQQLQQGPQAQASGSSQKQGGSERTGLVSSHERASNASPHSLSPLSSPRAFSPRDVAIEQEEYDFEEDGEEGGNESVDGSAVIRPLARRPTSPGKTVTATPLSLSSSKPLEESELTSSMSPNSSSSNLPDRIKRFDWRKGNSSSDLRRKRRSVEELVVEETGDDDGQQDSESSLAVRVPSDDDDFDIEDPKALAAAAAAVRKSPRAPSVAASTSNPVQIAAQSPVASVGTAAAVTTVAPAQATSGEKGVSFVPIVSSTPPSGSTSPSKAKSGKIPALDVSRTIRKAYESVEPVKLKALADNDPSIYCWKVLHSLNQQKLGYASVRHEDVEFYDLRGHKVLTVPKHDLPGLNVPAARWARVEKMLAQMRKSSQQDVRSELSRIYEADGTVLLRRARNAEFEFRVMQDGDQLGWASRAGLDTQFYDMNGVLLWSVATESLGPAVLEVGAGRVMPLDVRALFKTQKQVSIISSSDPSSRFEYRVVTSDDGNVPIGWGEREAFDFAFFDLTGRCLGRVPLSAMTGLSPGPGESSPPPSKASGSKRSSSGLGGKNSLLLNRLKDSSKKAPSSPSSPRATSVSPTVSSSPLGRSGSAGTLLKTPAVQETLPGETSPAKEKKGSNRRLSEWQLKIRTKTESGTIPSSAPGQKTGAKGRKDSVDYTPDGLSPELVGSGYDIKSTHKPMGLAGLLEPDDSEK